MNCPTCGRGVPGIGARPPEGWVLNPGGLLLVPPHCLEGGPALPPTLFGLPVVEALPSRVPQPSAN